MEKDILERLRHVEQSHRNLKKRLWISFAVTIAALLGFGFYKTKKFDIIRAKGIVIEDSRGKDRILIGAPIPFSPDRVRTDTARVRENWASRVFPKNPGQFMEYYKSYYHSTDGIVIMNEKGFDRVLLGDKLADANTGKRNFEAAGISWNDREGFELGGAGVNTTDDGQSRGVIGLDDKDGEALHIVTIEDGTKAIIIGGENGRLMIGMSKKNGQWFQNTEEFTGIRLFDASGKLVWEQQMNAFPDPKPGDKK